MRDGVLGRGHDHNHPFWDPPSQADEAAAGHSCKREWRSAREKLHLAAVAELYA